MGSFFLFMILATLVVSSASAVVVEGPGSCVDDASVVIKRVTTKDQFKNFLVCAQMRAPVLHTIEVGADIQLTGAYLPSSTEEGPSGLKISGFTNVRIVGVSYLRLKIVDGYVHLLDSQRTPKGRHGFAWQEVRAQGTRRVRWLSRALR